MRAFWEQQGSEYDHRAAHGIFSEAERRLWMTALGAIPPSSRVLDIGTGTGFVALLLAELGHHVTGVDASETMLANARVKAAKRGLAITFVEGVTERLPFADASFDAVTARHFIWTLLEPNEAFAEWRRVLTPSGTLVADCSLDPQVAAHHYTDDVAAALPFRGVVDPTPVDHALRSAGFGEVDVDLSSDIGEYRRAMLRARAGIAGQPAGTP
jgi:ubiquinone/menaquinone biosynthesis C-methylase UbiE